MRSTTSTPTYLDLPVEALVPGQLARGKWPKIRGAGWFCRLLVR